jgi:hypothetical protein
MVSFSQLLGSSDFRSSVDGIATTFRDSLGLPPVHQLGLVVADVEQAAVGLEDRGIPPFFIAQGSPVLWRERGIEGSFKGKLGMIQYRGFELELLEPGTGSDFYRECLDPKGEIVVQHLGFLVKDVDEWAGRTADRGFPVRVRGRLKFAAWEGNFAYMDTMKAAGVVIEFISWTILGRRQSLPPPGLLRLLGRFQKWSGWRCISV